MNHSPSRVKKKKLQTYRSLTEPRGTRPAFSACVKRCCSFFLLFFFFFKVEDFRPLQTTFESVLYILIPDAGVLLPCASFYCNTYPDSGGASKWLAQFAPLLLPRAPASEITTRLL